VIVGKLPTVRLTRDLESEGEVLVRSGTVIDNLLIVARGIPIDDDDVAPDDNTLAQAERLWVRPDGSGDGAGLPAASLMELDTADLESMESDGSLADVIAHEMGHAIGIGEIWQDKGLLRDAGTSNPTFTGPKAMEEYAALRGTNRQEPVPVDGTEEDEGDEEDEDGTADSHWRTSVFGDELMTGSGGSPSPMSRLTVASLADLGYQVDLEAADPYDLPGRDADVEFAATPALRAQHKRRRVIRPMRPVKLPPESLVG